MSDHKKENIDLKEKFKETMKDNKKNNESEKKSDEKVNEETEAQASLHPGARSINDPKAISKSGMMNSTMGLMSGMNKDEMIDFFEKVMTQFHPNKDLGVADNSAKNTNSLDMKGSYAIGKGGASTKQPMERITKDPITKMSVKEDLQTIFDDNNELSEEFKENATTLFEAAVSARISAEIVRLEEQYETNLQEQMETFSNEVNTKLDSYLDYVVENWIAENQIAIESSLRNELTNEFIDGLKALFVEHYVEIPEDRVNVLESLADKVNELEEQLNNVISENVELKNNASSEMANKVFESVSEDLADTQREKFLTLAEGIEYDGNDELYNKKLSIIKEKYFSNKEVTTTNLNEETYNGPETEIITKNIDPSINRYVQALDRTVKK